MEGVSIMQNFNRPMSKYLIQLESYFMIPRNYEFGFVIVAGVWAFAVILEAIERNLLAISVKVGLSNGSAAQHLSIRDLQSGSQFSGTGGLNVLLIMPPVYTLQESVSSLVNSNHF